MFDMDLMIAAAAEALKSVFVEAVMVLVSSVLETCGKCLPPLRNFFPTEILTNAFNALKRLTKKNVSTMIRKLSDPISL